MRENNRLPKKIKPNRRNSISATKADAAMYPQMYMMMLDTTFSRSNFLLKVKENIEDVILDDAFFASMSTEDKMKMYKMVSDEYTNERRIALKMYEVASKNANLKTMMDTTPPEDVQTKSVTSGKPSKKVKEMRALLYSILDKRIEENNIAESSGLKIDDEGVIDVTPSDKEE